MRETVFLCLCVYVRWSPIPVCWPISHLCIGCALSHVLATWAVLTCIVW